MRKEKHPWWITAGTLALVVGLVVGASSLSGCAPTAGIEGSAEQIGPADSGQYSSYVVVNNPKMARGIQIVDLETGYAGNLLKANVTLVSKYSDTQNFKYKFSWFDADGVEIDANSTPWIPMLLYGNETKTIQGVAPNPTAKKFKIKLR